MAVGLSGVLPTLWPVAGIQLAATCAGIKQRTRPDLVGIEICDGGHSVAVFTRNAFCAAPVVLARQHLAEANPRFLLINSGNANAGTGDRGLADALACCEAVAACRGLQAREVLPFSTGVIGEPLPVAAVTGSVRGLCAGLGDAHWAEAAAAIMTTDTVPKGASRRVEIGGSTITVTGIAKGSGMIKPNMATMLAYIGTDAGMTPDLMQTMLQEIVEKTFNCITVDGDTSTNDACVLMATGRSGVTIQNTEQEGYALLRDTLFAVCLELAQAIVRDGEGASKFITVTVEGGVTEAECRGVAEAVAQSPLVKTAFFASDPNWGRILAAIGRAGIADLDIHKITVSLDDVAIVEGGARAPGYREALGAEVMRRAEITVRIDLGRGSAKLSLWTCDLSYDYVRINAEYRS